MSAADLAARLAAEPYRAYSYSYPHKTAYRELERPVPLAPLWRQEKRDALFLYLHVPFCEMRCGFCNLFTLAKPDPELPRRYVEQVLRQMAVVAAELGEHRVARFAVGGGTPTYLSLPQLQTLFEGAARHFGLDLARTPASVEVSPETASADKLAWLRQAGVDRVSIGVQSFVEAETDQLIRPQPQSRVATALERIRHAGFALLNLDLIYGIAGQTRESFAASLREALRWRPEEIYLYPLYVRPLTGLGQIRERGVEGYPRFALAERGGEDKTALYRTGRDLLLEAGYRQVSMRMFRLPDATGKAAPVYCCQEDGMVGLGSGARSYTRQLHYSTEYAVGRPSVREIIEDFCATPPERFASARYGIHLDAAELKRRYVIQSLLILPGLDLAAYRRRFDEADALADLPMLGELVELGLAACSDGVLTLTESGMALCDGIGPALISPEVERRMRSYELA